MAASADSDKSVAMSGPAQDRRRTVPTRSRKACGDVDVVTERSMGAGAPTSEGQCCAARIRVIIVQTAPVKNNTA
jgi:hypothetical protein